MKQEDQCQGAHDFDGNMHLQTLINQAHGQRKLFTCRKDPIIQIISGLKDPNMILTVNLQVVESPCKSTLKQKAFKSRKLSTKDLLGSVQQSQFSTGQSQQELHKRDQMKKEQQHRRYLQNMYEWNQNFDKIFHQYKAQIGAPEEYYLESQTENGNENEDHLKPEPDEKTGNSLVSFPYSLKSKRDGIDGLWWICY